MGNIFNTGVSALLSFQRSLSTSSHNIANANTPGYSRQRVDLVARPPQEFGFGFVGNGVAINDIARLNNKFIDSKLESAISENGRLQTYSALTKQVNDMLADDASGLNTSMQRFFNSLQDVANDPASLSARQVFLSESQGVVDRFRTLDNFLLQSDIELNDRINVIVNQVNGLAQSIADVNNAIASVSTGANEGKPNDLLDQRDQLIKELSELVSVTTVESSNDTKNVFFGNGQILVFGNDARQLTTVRNPEYFAQLNVAYQTSSGTQDITSELTGGQIGGVLDFRNTVLDQTRRDIGRIAMVLGDTFNAQHREGMNLNGVMGSDFFNAPAPIVVDNLANTGSATVTATLTNSAALTTSDYRLTYDGATYTLTRISDSTSVSGAGPLAMDGINIAIGAGALAGDSFLIRPTFSAASSLALNISNLNDIAAAGPVRVSADSGNLGDASIDFNQILNSADPDLLDTVDIVFNNPPTDFDIVNITDASTIASGVAYVAGADIDFNGVRVNITGTPQAGDTFRVQSNVGGINDNRNALELVSLRTQNLIAGGLSFEQAYNSSVAQSGALASRATTSSEAQANLLNQLHSEREAVSGVNLDEEAADLMRFQQAYEAAAQMITVANSLFDTLIGAIRR